MLTMRVITERINRTILMNFCSLLIDVSEIEKTIIPRTPISIILKIRRKFLSLYGSFAANAMAIRYITKVVTPKD